MVCTTAKARATLENNGKGATAKDVKGTDADPTPISNPDTQQKSACGYADYKWEIPQLFYN